jgi:hypothetical protein
MGRFNPRCAPAADNILPYLSGFFDGEGCIYVSPNGSINCRVVNTGLPVLEMYKDLFGGSILNRKQRTNKNQFVWSVYGDEAVYFLEDIFPFSLEKRSQMEIVFKWHIERKSLQATNVGYCKGKRSHEDREGVLSLCRERLSKLKKEEFDAI